MYDYQHVWPVSSLMWGYYIQSLLNQLERQGLMNSGVFCVDMLFLALVKITLMSVGFGVLVYPGLGVPPNFLQRIGLEACSSFLVEDYPLPLESIDTNYYDCQELDFRSPPNIDPGNTCLDHLTGGGGSLARSPLSEGETHAIDIVPCHYLIDKSHVFPLATITPSALDVLMKPGKPLTFATIDIAATQTSPEKMILAFGLPGNPVSCLVGFHLLVVPAIRCLAGWRDPKLRRVQVRISDPIRLDPFRPEFHRATIRWEPNDGSGRPGFELKLNFESGVDSRDFMTSNTFVAESTGRQVSSRLLSMKSANSLLEMPAANKILPAGTMVWALLISDISSMPLFQSPVSTELLYNDQNASTKYESIDKSSGSDSSDKRIKVAILTVSDTVASGAGPDRSIFKELTFCYDCTSLHAKYPLHGRCNCHLDGNGLWITALMKVFSQDLLVSPKEQDLVPVSLKAGKILLQVSLVYHKGWQDPSPSKNPFLA
eukprot:Gb_17889 [translate_table: standard]